MIPSVRFHLPAEPLRDLVTSYYFFESADPVEDRFHPEWGNVRFLLRGGWDAEQFFTRPPPPPERAALFGPTDRSRWFRVDRGMTLGVGLTPIGWQVLIGTDASALANRLVDLGDRLGVPGDMLADALRELPDDAGRVALLDRTLATRAGRRGPPDALTLAVHRGLVEGGPRDVAGLCAALGCDARRLQRVCQRSFGFTPKRLIRRQRFLRTLAQVRDRLDRPLAEIVDPDYYDQAHFIHDFQSYMGMSPSAYFNSPREVMRRAAAERDRVVGAPVQGLHRPG